MAIRRVEGLQNFDLSGDVVTLPYKTINIGIIVKPIDLNNNKIAYRWKYFLPKK